MRPRATNATTTEPRRLPRSTAKHCTDHAGNERSVLEHATDTCRIFMALTTQTHWGRLLDRTAGHTLGETDVMRLAIVAGLRNLGRCAAPYQAGIAQRATVTQPHMRSLRELIRADVLGADADIAARMVGAIIAHWGAKEHLLGPDHAQAHDGTGDWHDAGWLREEGYDPQDQVGAVHEALSYDVGCRAAFEKAPKMPTNPAFLDLYHGLTATADWLAHDVSLRRKGTNGLDPAAGRSVVMAVMRHDLAPFGEEPGTRRYFDEREPDHWSRATPMRRALEGDDLAPHLRDPTAATQATTAGGRIHAGFQRWMDLTLAGQVDALIYAVHAHGAATHALDALQDLATKYLGSMPSHWGHREFPIRMAHRRNDRTRDDVPDAPRLPWEGDAPPDASALAAMAITARFVSRITVTTHEELMRMDGPEPHAAVRRALAARALVVVDSPPTDAVGRSLLQAALSRHTAMGGRALLIDLPGHGWGDAAGIAQIEEIDIPAIRSRRNRRVAAPEPVELPPRTIAAKWVGGDAAEIGRLAHGLAADGTRVLVVRDDHADLVATAQAMRAAEQDENLRYEIGCCHALYRPYDLDRAQRTIAATFRREEPEDARSTPRTRCETRLGCASPHMAATMDLWADVLVTDVAPTEELARRLHLIGTGKRGGAVYLVRGKTSQVDPEDESRIDQDANADAGAPGDSATISLPQDLAKRPRATENDEDEAGPIDRDVATTRMGANDRTVSFNGDPNGWRWNRPEDILLPATWLQDVPADARPMAVVAIESDVTFQLGDLRFTYQADTGLRRSRAEEDPASSLATTKRINRS